MTTELIDLIQKISRREMERLYVSEIGVVVKVHEEGPEGEGYGCDVKLRNSGLELPLVPMVTPRIGSVAPPNVGDTVLLTFSQGDLQQPMMLGRLYTDAVHAPASKFDQVLFCLPYDGKIEENRQIRMMAAREQEGDAPHKVSLVLPENKVQITVDDQTVSVILGEGAVVFSLTTTDSGPSATVSIKDGDASILLGKDGSINVKAAKDLTLEAENGTLSLSAEKIEMKGKTQVTVDGGSSTELKAATINVKGMTSFST
ncbi:phage baseplate assembly protein V [Desulfosediminicola flagellatus]|uniref:phage baseplate assembly protein V n=1 Tax=Desulfosediminicola flagellatus TaxID=2569541 RepID=UPI0010ABEDA7|nr:phage baseplate assembly protein V [Desulfosediminicola flagellatus]